MSIKTINSLINIRSHCNSKHRLSRDNVMLVEGVRRGLHLQPINYDNVKLSRQTKVQIKRF